MLKKILFFISVTLIYSSECSKILIIFNTASKSHSILGAKLAEGLIKRNHHVTLVTPFEVNPMENCTHIQLKSLLEYKNEMAKKNITVSINKLKMLYLLMNSFSEMNNLFWKEPGIQKIIKEKPKFDLLIMFCFMSDAVLGLGHHLGVPIISFSGIGSSSMANKYFANLNVPYAPNPMFSMSTDNFFGRLFAFTINFLIDCFSVLIMDPMQEAILEKYLPDSPSLTDLKANISLLLVNSHFSIEPPRPYLPNMIQIGGYHIQDSKPLPEDIKSFLDDAKDGAILFSMGSNILTSFFEKEKLQIILDELGKIAHMKVIFKSELEHANIPGNIMVKKWLPQADILGHPNMKLFISHGGLGGNTESVFHGVPILGLPFFADQKMNMENAAKGGYAVIVHYDQLTQETFSNALRTILTNQTYSKNVKMRSALIKNQPVKPMDNAVFWIEHVIKYGGGSHLKNAGMDLYWFQLYMLDIFIFYLFAIVFIYYLSVFIAKCSYRIVKRMFFENSEKIKVH